MELEDLREEIRRADEQMAPLFARRMAAARKIAEYKRAHGLPVEDKAQEARVLAGRGALMEDDALRPFYLEFLQDTMEVSKRWQRRWSEQPGAALRVGDGADGYDVVVERGCLPRAGERLNLRRRVLIVTDEGVPETYAETVAAQCAAPLLHPVPQGEGSKSLSALEAVLGAMLRAGFTRGDCVCAVGGGVVGDLAGLAAAVYMRGVDFYNLPTTLLSQVDSSVGGKTAVNLGGVKNIVGVFRRPTKVLIDPDTLRTLPRRQLACGLAEALKAGLIGDASLLALLESLLESEMTAGSFEQVVAAALKVKIRIVEQDVSERGARRALNFGHTIGHAIESVAGLPHGECVALGMLPMVPPALRARLERVYARMGLPTQVRADPEMVYAALLHDKKMNDGQLMTVFVETPGQYTLRAVAPETLRAGIEMVVKA